jgi:hypothetical protein
MPLLRRLLIIAIIMLFLALLLAFTGMVTEETSLEVRRVINAANGSLYLISMQNFTVESVGAIKSAEICVNYTCSACRVYYSIAYIGATNTVVNGTLSNYHCIGLVSTRFIGFLKNVGGNNQITISLNLALIKSKFWLASIASLALLVVASILILYYMATITSRSLKKS